MLHNMKNRVSCALLMTGITLAPAIGLATDATTNATNRTAGSSDGTLSGTVTSLTAFFKDLGPLIGSIAMVAGLIFFVASVFTFKQHRDNPTQVPIGKPITQMCISVVLMFMGQIIQPLGKTFGWTSDAGNNPKSILDGDAKKKK